MGVTKTDDMNPGVPLKASIRVPLRGSFKGSVGPVGFYLVTDDSTWVVVKIKVPFWVP